MKWVFLEREREREEREREREASPPGFRYPEGISAGDGCLKRAAARHVHVSHSRGPRKFLFRGCINERLPGRPWRASGCAGRHAPAIYPLDKLFLGPNLLYVVESTHSLPKWSK